MPTKRVRLIRRPLSRALTVDAGGAELDVDLVRALSDQTPARRFPLYFEDIPAAWAAIGGSIVARWIRENPGTRPAQWWRFEAREPRRRCGGSGTPAHEVLGYAPTFALGVPLTFVDVVEANPPRFESQAAFLKRLCLLAPGEGRRIAPGEIEPVAVPLNGGTPWWWMAERREWAAPAIA